MFRLLTKMLLFFLQPLVSSRDSRMTKELKRSESFLFATRFLDGKQNNNEKRKNVSVQGSQESGRSVSSLIFAKLRHLPCSTVLHRGKGDQQGREWLKDWCHYVIPAHFRKRRMFIFHSWAVSLGNRALLSVFRYAWVHSGRSDETTHNILIRIVCHHFFLCCHSFLLLLFYDYLTDFTFLIH